MFKAFALLSEEGWVFPCAPRKHASRPQGPWTYWVEVANRRLQTVQERAVWEARKRKSHLWVVDDVWDATAETGSQFWVRKSNCPCWLARAKITSLEQRVKGVKCCCSCQWSEMHPSLAVHQTPRPDMSQRQAWQMWSSMSIGACMRGTCTHERSCFQREGFWTSVHIYCALGDGLDPSLVHMEISGGVSALCSWEGEGIFVRQEKEGLDLDKECVLQGGLWSAWTMHSLIYIPIYWSMPLTHLSSSMYCIVIPAPELERIL